MQKSVTFHSPLDLELGGQLPEVTVAFETYGRLNPQGDNAVLICHALSGDSHVARHDDDDDPGWWDVVVGPGKAIDTDRYFVICPNVLGGCRGTTGPNSDQPGHRPTLCHRLPRHHRRRHRGSPAAVDRPSRHSAVAGGRGRLAGRAHGIDVGDPICRSPGRRGRDCHFAAIDQSGLGLRRGRPQRHSQRPRLPSTASIIDRGRGPVVGLAIARMLGHITYLSREAMIQKFDAERLSSRHKHPQFETKFAVGSYLAYQGDRFGERFDANSFLTLTTAIDLFDLGGTHEQLAQALEKASCRWLLVSFTQRLAFSTVAVAGNG